MPWKSRVKPRDFPVLSARGLLYLFRCLIFIPYFTSLNLRGLMPLFDLSLLPTTLDGLRYSCICYVLNFLVFLLGHFYIEDDPKAQFSLIITPRSMGERYSFPWIWYLTECKQKSILILKWTVWNCTVHIYKNEFDINNLQWLINHKTKAKQL